MRPKANLATSWWWVPCVAPRVDQSTSSKWTGWWTRLLSKVLWIKVGLPFLTQYRKPQSLSQAKKPLRPLRCRISSPNITSEGSSKTSSQVSPNQSNQTRTFLLTTSRINPSVKWTSAAISYRFKTSGCTSNFVARWRTVCKSKESSSRNLSCNSMQVKIKQTAN